jgi:hypothetical protein
MKTIRIVLLLCMVFPSFLSAGIFYVSDATQFQSALNTAKANGQDDVILVAPGFYNLSSLTLTYYPTDNYDLYIQGYGKGVTVLYGGNVNRIMEIDTLDLADDSSVQITINGLTFRNGKDLDEHGGGLSVDTHNANVTLINSEFKGNVCRYSGGGASVNTTNGILIISHNIFIENSNVGGGPSYVVYSGGGLSTGSFYGTVNLESNIFIDNAAVSQGGGANVFSSGGTMNISNNMFRGNHSYSSDSVRGAGAYFELFTGLLNMTNNTFTYNSAVHGGGFYITLNDDSATADIYNNIIWGNTALGDSDDFYIMDDREWNYTGSLVHLYYNNFREYYIEDGDHLYLGANMDADPCFAPSFHLQSNSPCIDAGTNSAPILPVSDYEGDPRIIDGNYYAVAIVDMGADENDGSMPVPVYDGNDFTGDGHSDLSVWRISSGTWYVSGVPAAAWGKVGDIPVNGNYDGDVNDTAEITVWRPSNGKWYVKGVSAITWGTDGDIPVPGDYNGNGTTDMAVWRPSDGKWYIKGISTTAWGTNGDIPVPGDYNGNGTIELAVWRPSNGRWFIKGASTAAWGTNGDIPVPGDYDGDGATEVAVWRPSNGRWYIKGLSTTVWGTRGDIPVPGDYDGDGATDIAVWRPSNGRWYIKGIGSYSWGLAGDMPLVR